ncbi:MAG: serine/threonine-protein kinase [Alistipes sp.]|nr:serine/threonine-protein kinase [Alistipes sp.]
MKYSEGYLLDNRYQFERYIGSGTFGEVWVAVDKATDLEVAIKVYISMDETGFQEFKKEFQISFELNHSNLLHANYLGVNADDKRPYLVMPFCPNGSVSSHIGSMSEADLWRFIRDVASGLAYLHSKNPPIIHQDIKPDNILILRNGDFVITDFGISKQLRATLRKSAKSLNSAGAISYMGPERFSKQYQAVKASDVWSMGASIFELATGELPFCGMGGSLLKQGADMPELPEEYSETLNMVCQACMTKETWNRPTAQQIADFATKYINGENPTPTWVKSTEVAQPTQAAPAVEEKKPEPTPEPAPAPTPEPAKNKRGNMNMTVVASQNVEPNVETPAAMPRFISSQEEQKSNIPAWVWIVVGLAGVLSGFVINYIM